MSDLDAQNRRLDAASWLEEQLAAAGLECGAGWVLYTLVDGITARLSAAACQSGCMWQIPNRFEDMTPEQRKNLEGWLNDD